MIFFIQRRNKDPKQVEKDTYLSYARLAGYYLGDSNIALSFYDDQHDLCGWVKD